MVLKQFCSAKVQSFPDSKISIGLITFVPQVSLQSDKPEYVGHETKHCMKLIFLLQNPVV